MTFPASNLALHNLGLGCQWNLQDVLSVFLIMKTAIDTYYSAGNVFVKISIQLFLLTFKYFPNSK